MAIAAWREGGATFRCHTCFALLFFGTQCGVITQHITPGGEILAAKVEESTKDSVGLWGTTVRPRFRTEVAQDYVKFGPAATRNANPPEAEHVAHAVVKKQGARRPVTR